MSFGNCTICHRKGSREVVAESGVGDINNANIPVSAVIITRLVISDNFVCHLEAVNRIGVGIGTAVRHIQNYASDLAEIID